MPKPDKVAELTFRPLKECPPITADTPLAFNGANGAELAIWNGEEWVPESEFSMFIEVEEDDANTRS